MPTLNEICELVRILEESKGFSRSLGIKVSRLNDESMEAKDEFYKYDSHMENDLAEELIDCIFFACSALSILKVDADKIFMCKWEKNIKRTRDVNKIDGFGK